MAPLTQHFPRRNTELSNLILRIFLVLGEEKAGGVSSGQRCPCCRASQAETPAVGPGSWFRSPLHPT